MKRSALILSVLLPVAAQAQAQSLDGTYALDCSDANPDSRLSITGEVASFYESTCLLTNPVAVRGMAGAVLFDLACAGEGETYSLRTLLMPGLEGGLVWVSEGSARTYARCE